MAAKVINKVMGYFGFDENPQEEDENEEALGEMEEEEEEEEKGRKSFSKKGSKVVDIHTAMTIKVVIVKPKDYEDCRGIADHLKSRKIVVLNVSDMETNADQRLLDFVSGACYALQATVEEVSSGTYILSPSNVEVTSDLKSELMNKGIFNWGK